MRNLSSSLGILVRDVNCMTFVWFCQVALTIELDDVHEFDSDLADAIIGNTRRYGNIAAEIVYEILPDYKEHEVSVILYNNYDIIISVLPKGRSFTANSGTKAAIPPKGRSSIANSGTQVAVLLGMNRCGSFPLLSAPHSLFSIWSSLKRSVKILGAPTWRWGEWIWLTGPSGLHRNSPQGLNISSIRVFDQIRDLEIPITLCPHSYDNC